MTRLLVTLGLLAATAGYVALHPPLNLALPSGALSACPTAFGPWNGSDLSFEDAVVDELKADDLLVRRYQDGDRVVWLCVIYHQNRRYGAHDPRLCYESQGYIVERGTQVRIANGSPAGLTVNRFVADRPHDRRVVEYWWTTAGLSTADADAFRRQMALSGALDNRSWGAFVRVETVVKGDDEAGASSAVSEFAGRVAAELPALFAKADSTGAGTP